MTLAEIHRIGIIEAFPQEINLLTNSLNEKNIEYLQNKKIITGKLAEKQVQIMLSGMGKVNASIASQLLISYFKILIQYKHICHPNKLYSVIATFIFKYIRQF